MLRKVLIEPPGGLLGPSDRLSMSTPSATACFAQEDHSVLTTHPQNPASQSSHCHTTE
jgi:hypothetical protein